MKYARVTKTHGRITLKKPDNSGRMNVLPDVRFDFGRFFTSCQRRRCIVTGDTSFDRNICQKCDVGLCVYWCFTPYYIR